MPNPVLGTGGFHHLAIKVRNFDKSVQLYTQTFGFVTKISWGAKTPTGDNRGILLDTGDGNYIELFSHPTLPPLPDPIPEGPIAHVAFRTTNVDAVIERARTAGLKITMEPKSIEIPSTPPTPARIAFCQGYDGESLEFFQNDRT